LLVRRCAAGIDLVYYASGRDIEYDFVLRPGADPNQIKLAYNKPVRVDSNGDLLIAGLKQHRPKVLQDGREIACDYLMRGERVKLALATYDHSQPLTVDPVLEFSTYLLSSRSIYESPPTDLGSKNFLSIPSGSWAVEAARGKKSPRTSAQLQGSIFRWRPARDNA
jgi:hypothetical protein